MPACSGPTSTAWTRRTGCRTSTPATTRATGAGPRCAPWAARRAGSTRIRPRRPSFADTPLLERCPGVRAVLDRFLCPLLAVRFLRLGAGSRIREHKDHNLGFADGEVRIHVPVRAVEGVEFLLDGRRVDMAEGEAWYLDLNLRHSVVNHGDRPRVHLVVDCIVDEWLRTILEQVLEVGTARDHCRR